MAKLSEVAEKAKDLYYQDYAPRTAFFDLEDFKFQCAARYSTMLNAMFQLVRKENKQETGYNNVDINPQWCISEPVEAIDFDEKKNEYSVKTKFPVFSFDFDAFAAGLYQIRPFDKKCTIKKISTNELPFQGTIPVTGDVYYYLQGSNKIPFLGIPKLPLTLEYIPQINSKDENCVMSDNIVMDIITATLQLMFGAKKGNVIQEIDDGNENPVLETQINPRKN